MHNVRKLILSCALAYGFSMGSESFGGIGVTISPSQSGVQVVDVIPGSPAALSGLQANDQIISVNGQSLAGLSIDQSRELLRGMVGSTVQVGLIRGIVPISTTMNRASLEVIDLNTQKVAAWYGKTSDLSGDELGYLAAQESHEGVALLGVMQNGKVLTAESSVNAEQIQGVFVALPKEDKSASLQKTAGSMLRSFSRSSISFELKSAGATQLEIMDSNGKSIKSFTVENGAIGANTLDWDGATLPTGRYQLRISQLGSNSSYPVVLR